MLSLRNMTDTVKAILAEMLVVGPLHSATCCGKTYYGLQPPAICGTCKKEVTEITVVDSVDTL